MHLVGLNYSSQSRVGGTVVSSSEHKILKRQTGEYHICEQHMACPMILPRKLKWVDMPRSGIEIQQIPELVLMQNSTLNFIKASDTGIESFQFLIFSLSMLLLEINSTT